MLSCQCDDVLKGSSLCPFHVRCCETLVCQPISAYVQQSDVFSGLDLADQSDGEGSRHVNRLRLLLGPSNWEHL